MPFVVSPWPLFISLVRFFLSFGKVGAFTLKSWRAFGGSWASMEDEEGHFGAQVLNLAIFIFQSHIFGGFCQTKWDVLCHYCFQVPFFDCLNVWGSTTKINQLINSQVPTKKKEAPAPASTQVVTKSIDYMLSREYKRLSSTFRLPPSKEFDL